MAGDRTTNLLPPAAIVYTSTAHSGGRGLKMVARTRVHVTHAWTANSVVRKILHYSVHLPVSSKVPTLMAILMLLSCVAWLDLSPKSSWLSDKRNAINSLLVKWSWGWSLLCLFPSVMLTAFLYSGLQLRQVLLHFSRLVVAHWVWFSFTRAFVFLDSAVGSCSDSVSTTRSQCVQENNSWSGFDISGHTFLLTYCVYVLTEEVSGLRQEVWGEYDSCLEMEYRAVNKLTGVVAVLPRLHKLTSPLAHSLELFAAALMTVWVTMVITTSLYFHSIPEKLIGGMCSWLAWQLTYGWLYGKAYMPIRPDQGLLHPLKHCPTVDHERSTR